MDMDLIGSCYTCDEALSKRHTSIEELISSAPEDDVDGISDSISAAEALIADVDAAAERARAAIAHLEADRGALVEFISKQRRLLPGPISHLPPEILAEIFVLCTVMEREDEDASFSEVDSESSWSDDDSSDTDDLSTDLCESDSASYLDEIVEALGSRDDRDLAVISDVESDSGHSRNDRREPGATSRSPWLLTQVCRQWRAIALTLPLVWTIISVDLDVKRFYRRVTSLSLLQRQLELSGNLPLSVQFYSENDDDRARMFVDAVAAHSNRWKELDLCVNDTLLDYLASITRSVNSLAELSISIPSTRLGALTHMTAFLDAPRMRTFNAVIQWSSAAGVPLVTDPPFAIPWSQLTSICLSLNIIDSLTILRQMPDLVDCQLSIIDAESETAFHIAAGGFTEKVQLLALRRFELTAGEDKHVAILNFLEIPNLVDFTLVPEPWRYRSRWGSSSDSDLLHIAPLCDFLRRSSPSSISLAAHMQRNYTIPISPELFESMSGVEELAISAIRRDGDPGPSWLSNLNYDPSGEVQLLPMLQHLRLVLDPIDVKDAITLLESRRSQGIFSPEIRQLQICRLQVCPYFTDRSSCLDDDDIARLSKLRDDGLDIHSASPVLYLIGDKRRRWIF